MEHRYKIGDKVKVYFDDSPKQPKGIIVSIGGYRSSAKELSYLVQLKEETNCKDDGYEQLIDFWCYESSLKKYYSKNIQKLIKKFKEMQYE